MLRMAIGVVLLAGFLAAMFFATVQEASVTCEVCVEFGGRSNCGTASGIDRSAAVNAAHSAACAILSGGVTQGLQCDRASPRSVSCTE
jgi:hypothetical protein